MSTVMPSRIGHERLVTDDLVLAWRWERLLRLGFHPDMADHLADLADVDLHSLEHCLARGCSHEQAFRIFS